MPRVMASGLSMLAGVLMLCISHCMASSLPLPLEEGMLFDTEDFYMNQVWSCLCTMFRMHCFAHWQRAREIIADAASCSSG